MKACGRRLRYFQTLAFVALSLPVAAKADWFSDRRAEIVGSVERGVDQAQRDLANGRDAVNAAAANAETTLRTEVGPAINHGVIHIVGEADKGMPWGDHHCGDNPQNYGCPNARVNGQDASFKAQPELGPWQPVLVVSVSGRKIPVVFENRATTSTVFEVYDLNGKGWVFSQTLAPGQKVTVMLVVDDMGHADAALRKDHRRGADTHYSFLRSGEVAVG